MLKRFAVLFAVLASIAAACSDDAVGPAPDDSTKTTGAVRPVGQNGGTLDEVRTRGRLICGISGSAVGFSEMQVDGSASGFDADWCRAVAAAVLGDASAVQFRALTAAESFDALKDNEIDILIPNASWTQTRDTDIGVDFAPTTYFDGQQLMGKRAFPFTENSTLEDLGGVTICTNAGTITEKNIIEGAQANNAVIALEPVKTFPEAMEKFMAGTCDLVTTDGSNLAGMKFTQDPDDDWVIFPSAPISKEPLGPVYRSNDAQWGDIINWMVFAAIIADELRVTSANVDSMMDITPEATRLFGGEGELQTRMGLNADSFLQVIKQVGNYDEIYARNLNPVGLKREGSLNARFNEGGMIYAPPAR